jgi:hypothetical protein
MSRNGYATTSDLERREKNHFKMRIVRSRSRFSGAAATMKPPQRRRFCRQLKKVLPVRADATLPAYFAHETPVREST